VTEDVSLYVIIVSARCALTDQTAKILDCGSEV